MTSQTVEAPVTYEVRNGVAWLTMNRPEARNALNKALREGLFEAVRRFNEDDDARCSSSPELARRRSAPVAT